MLWPWKSLSCTARWKAARWAALAFCTKAKCPIASPCLLRDRRFWLAHGLDSFLRQVRASLNSVGFPRCPYALCKFSSSKAPLDSSPGPRILTRPQITARIHLSDTKNRINECKSTIKNKNKVNWSLHVVFLYGNSLTLVKTLQDAGRRNTHSEFCRSSQAPLSVD